MNTSNHEKFKIGASHTIGTYVLPGELITNIHQQLDRRITLKISPSHEIVKAVKSGKLDLGFIEFEIENEQTLISLSWMKDELVFCAKKELPPTLSAHELKKYTLLCDKVESVDRNALDLLLLKHNMHHSDFISLREIDNSTAIIQNLKYSNPHANTTTIAVVSKLAIEYELKHNHFYLTSLNHAKILKRFYVVYRNDSPYLDTIKVIYKKILND